MYVTLQFCVIYITRFCVTSGNNNNHVFCACRGQQYFSWDIFLWGGLEIFETPVILAWGGGRMLVSLMSFLLLHMYKCYLCFLSFCYVCNSIAYVSIHPPTLCAERKLNWDKNRSIQFFGGHGSILTWCHFLQKERGWEWLWLTVSAWGCEEW